MRSIDKTALLFELLLGTDMFLVNQKIEKIRYSPEYMRLYRASPMLSKTQSLTDVAQRFAKIDLYGILSLKRALEVEQEIYELDRRLKKFPSINPYLSDGNEKDYNVKTLGNIGVEINAQGMSLNDFVTYKGVLSNNRKKILKLKAFNWYKEAKVALMEMVDNSNLMLRKIRNGKVFYFSLGIEFYLSLITTSVLLIYILFCPEMASYRTNPNNFMYNLLLIINLVSNGVVMCLHKIYVSFPFRIASAVRRQVITQERLSQKLDQVSSKFERQLINKAKAPQKMDILLKKIAIVGENRHYSPIDLLDYAYCEKEYYYCHHRALLFIYNIFFVISFLVGVTLFFLVFLGI